MPTGFLPSRLEDSTMGSGLILLSLLFLFALGNTINLFYLARLGENQQKTSASLLLKNQLNLSNSEVDPQATMSEQLSTEDLRKILGWNP